MATATIVTSTRIMKKPTHRAPNATHGRPAALASVSLSVSVVVSATMVPRSRVSGRVCPAGPPPAMRGRHPVRLRAGRSGSCPGPQEATRGTHALFRAAGDRRDTSRTMTGFDHVPGHTDQLRFLDTWTLVTSVAARTAHIRRTRTVVRLPLPPPAVLARGVLVGHPFPRSVRARRPRPEDLGR